MTTPYTILPVILCGGSGTRLWPLSRAGFPKQFLCLTGSQSLFQQAALRLASLPGVSPAPIVICNEDHRFLCLEQLREVGITGGQILLEPIGRNTAPALTFAALQATQQGQDAILVVTPADQTIGDESAYQQALQRAIERAAEGEVVILGVHPSRPETGFGYISAAGEGAEARTVERFVEKPNTATAQAYLQEGGYFWNAGMFLLKASVWLEALGHCRPDILEASRVAVQATTTDGQFVRPDREAFQAIPSESIDYAVMEHLPGSKQGIRLSMVPLDAAWSDLGAWDAVWAAHSADESGNVLVGDVMAHGSQGCLVHASSRLVGVVGLENVVVVETADAVLVADKSRSQEVKQIVAQLSSSQREEHSLHRKVHRPWGWYDSIDECERFKVKRIQVKPKASLSLQMHHHRAEHWIVVKGTAEITVGDRTFLLGENQSTFIPLGETHRLANPGSIPLEIIEVQSGSYLGEDDIVRFQDTYGRAQS